MDSLHRMSALSLLIGIFVLIYGIILFQFRMIAGGVILVWIGVGLEQDLWKRQQRENRTHHD